MIWSNSSVSTIYLTGSTGFVGSKLIKCLSSAGFRVVTVSLRGALSDIRSGSLASVMVEVSPQTGKFNESLLTESLVIHCASVTPRLVGPLRLVESNLSIAEKCVAFSDRVGCRRVMNISSTRVYGYSDPGSDAFDWSSTPNPVDAYARSKLAVEDFFSKIPNLKVLNLRVCPIIDLEQKKGFAAHLEKLSRFDHLIFPIDIPSHSKISLGKVTEILMACMHKFDTADRSVYTVCDRESMALDELLDCLNPCHESAKRRRIKIPLAIANLPIPVLRKIALIWLKSTVARADIEDLIGSEIL